MKKNPQVDHFLRNAKQWRKELERLRAILRGFPLTEELKWAKPCYTFQGTNVVILIPFKESCVLMFCKGSLLQDPKGILVKPGENSQSSRFLRFTSVGEVVAMKATVKAYVEEAIAAEKAGLKIKFIKMTERVFPQEFQSKLDGNAALKAAFAALTPGRQRGYHLFFSAPKQASTREARVAKCLPRILQGKGLND